MAAAKAPALTSDAILHHNAWGEDVAQTDHLSGNAILRGLHTSMAWRGWHMEKWRWWLDRMVEENIYAIQLLCLENLSNNGVLQWVLGQIIEERSGWSQTWLKKWWQDRSLSWKGQKLLNNDHWGPSREKIEARNCSLEILLNYNPIVSNWGDSGQAYTNKVAARPGDHYQQPEENTHQTY